MTGSPLRVHAVLAGENAREGVADREQCRLRVRRELEGVFGTLEAEGGQREAQGLVRLAEDLAAFGERLGEGSSHPHLLGTLSREEERGLHRCPA